MNVLIALFGLLSFTSMFLGTALAVLLVGFAFGLKVFVASLLVFLFCFVVDMAVKKHKKGE